jgi:hypothetical protein
MPFIGSNHVNVKLFHKNPEFALDGLPSSLAPASEVAKGHFKKGMVCQF